MEIEWPGKIKFATENQQLENQRLAENGLNNIKDIVVPFLYNPQCVHFQTNKCSKTAFVKVKIHP